MNIVVLVGRLTRDPELRTVNTANGMNSTCSFSVAVDRPFTNQKGEREADFVNCVIWGKQAENLAKFCSKGSLIGVEGRINTRNYDGQDGKKVYITEVAANNIRFLGNKNSGSTYQSDDQMNYSGNNIQNNNDYNSLPSNDLSEDPFKDFRNENFDSDENIVLSDDSLPF